MGYARRRQGIIAKSVCVILIARQSCEDDRSGLRYFVRAATICRVSLSEQGLVFAKLEQSAKIRRSVKLL